MDDIVKQAMAKWPKVPHCFGWLGLDARGGWRMRDERAQTLGLAGDRITNPALLAFINRNYTHDDAGRWYFQNGPQRVYVNLEATPYIVHLDPGQRFVLHTGETLAAIEQAWLTDAGQLLLKNGEIVALLDDRDIAPSLPLLRLNGAPAGDDALLGWLASPSDSGALTLEWHGAAIGIEFIAGPSLPARFGFQPEPRPDPA